MCAPAMLIGIGLLVSVGSAHAQEVANTPDATPIDFLLEDDIRTLRQRLREVDRRRVIVADLQARFEEVAIEETSLPADLGERQRQASDLVAEFRALPTDIHIGTDEGPLASLIQLAGGLVGPLNAPLDLIGARSREAAAGFDRTSYEYQIVSRVRATVRTTIQRESARVRETLSWTKYLLDQDLDVFPIFLLESGDRIPRSRANEAVTELERFFGQLPDELAQYSKLVQEVALSAKGDVLSQIASSQEAHENEQRQLRAELRQKLGQFEAIQKQEEKRRAQTDQNLVYAVYGMIVVLLLLFLGLRIFPPEVAKQLIEKRSLVEVIGMAFMLITIIILGTGERLNKEILGTLLGTIAGYIFGRGSQRPSDESS